MTSCWCGRSPRRTTSAASRRRAGSSPPRRKSSHRDRRPGHGSPLRLRRRRAGDRPRGGDGEDRRDDAWGRGQIAVERHQSGHRRRGRADRAAPRRPLRRALGLGGPDPQAGRAGQRRHAGGRDPPLAGSAPKVGLCRTEHMFFGPDREEIVRDMFVAAARRPSRSGGESEQGGRSLASASCSGRTSPGSSGR